MIQRVSVLAFILSIGIVLFCSAANDLHINHSCPFGTDYEVNGNKCVCKLHDLPLLSCDKTMSLPYCYCMSYNDRFNTTVVGYCVMRCQEHRRESIRYQVITHTNNLSEVNSDLCSGLHMNRTGQLCGSCVKGYAPPVYSYSMHCVECTSNHKYNWLKYIAVAYLPLTAFYIFVIVFRLSITSGKMNGYVLTIQLIAAPALTRFCSIAVFSNKGNNYTTILFAKILACFYAIFNLDFFRPAYSTFCLHPSMNTVQTLALDYAIAVYPLLLVIVTYIFASLHYRYSMVVRLWRPFYKCFIKLRKEWDIRSSLVEAFATFILLSYVKILNTSLDLLIPIFIQSEDGNFLKQPYLRVSGTVEYFGRDHLPYALLALFMLITFNILPMLLVFLYPCLCFQRSMNYFNIRRQKLHTFMEVFQGCFKTHPRDYRQFAAVYLLIRVINIALLSTSSGLLYFPIASIVLFVTALIIAITRPHRSFIYSIIDVTMFACIATALISGYTYGFILPSYSKYPYIKGLFYLGGVALSVHFLYGAGLIILLVIPQTRLKSFFKTVLAKVQSKNTQENQIEAEDPPKHNAINERTTLIQQLK